MSNPAIIVLSKMQKEVFSLVVEDNPGEAIHIHLIDGVVNIRIDLTIEEFFLFADEVEKSMNVLLGGKAMCADFDSAFLVGLSPIIQDLDPISYDKVLLEDLLSGRISEDGSFVALPLKEGRLSKSLEGDSAENDAYKQINLYLPRTATLSTNEDRLKRIYERIKIKGDLLDSDYLTLLNDTNLIWDGQHRAACLLAIKGNKEVKVRRLWFRQGMYIPYVFFVDSSLSYKESNFFYDTGKNSGAVNLGLLADIHGRINDMNERILAQIDGYVQSVSSLRSQIDAYERSVSSLKSQIDAYEQSTCSLRSQIDAYEQSTCSLRSQIDAYKHSTSWRITKPLRSLKRLLSCRVRREKKLANQRNWILLLIFWMFK